MNNFFQENIFAIILFLLLIILLLIALIGVIVVKLLLGPKDLVQVKEVASASPAITPEVITPTFKKLSEEKVVEKYYCENHKDIPSIGSCLICEDVFCEQCLIEHDGLYFCKEHFKIFANHKWKQITDVKTTPDTPEDGLYIYSFKRLLWRERKVPSFVLTHYKINIEEDFIESFIQLNVVVESAEELSGELENFKVRH